MGEATGLFLSNFETGNCSALTALVTDGSCTFSATSSAALHGAYGARATYDGAYNDSNGYISFTATTELYSRTYFKLNSTFNGDAGLFILFCLQLGTGNRLYCRGAVSGGVVTFNRFYHYGDAGSLFATISQTVSLDTTHYLEFHFKAATSAGANNGIAEVWYDGTLLASVTNVDSDTVTIDRVTIGQRGAFIPTNTSYIDFDDFKINSSYIGAYADQATSVPVQNISYGVTIPNVNIIQANNTITASPIQYAVDLPSINIVQNIPVAVNVKSIAYGVTIPTVNIMQTPAVIIDHTMVSKYSDIPQSYIDIIKTRWFAHSGESHSKGVRIGMALLAALEPKFDAIVQESGTPAMPGTQLRVNQATWGDVTHPDTWRYGTGEEDVFTNALAITRTKAHLQYCHTNGFDLRYWGFGWCWDMTQTNPVTTTKDPVYKCGWAGSCLYGPEGNLAWGLDDADIAITGNSVNLDTYLSAMQEYIDYVAANNIGTHVFYTTGPVDGYTGESGYQRSLKQQRIRDHVNTAGGYLWDYADTLCWDNAGNQKTLSWTDADAGVHTFGAIADDNMLDLDGSYTEDGDHIGQRGAVRLAKNAWVMMARMEGWNGLPEENSVNVQSITYGVTIQSPSIIQNLPVAVNVQSINYGVTIVRAAITQNIIFPLNITLGVIIGSPNIEQETPIPVDVESIAYGIFAGSPNIIQFLPVNVEMKSIEYGMILGRPRINYVGLTDAKLLLNGTWLSGSEWQMIIDEVWHKVLDIKVIQDGEWVSLIP